MLDSAKVMALRDCIDGNTNLTEQKICMSSLVVSKCELREEKVEGEILVHGEAQEESAWGFIKRQHKACYTRQPVQLSRLSPSGARSTELMQDETDNTPNSAVCPTPSS